MVTDAMVLAALKVQREMAPLAPEQTPVELVVRRMLEAALANHP